MISTENDIWLLFIDLDIDIYGISSFLIVQYTSYKTWPHFLFRGKSSTQHYGWGKHSLFVKKG